MIARISDHQRIHENRQESIFVRIVFAAAEQSGAGVALAPESVGGRQIAVQFDSVAQCVSQRMHDERQSHLICGTGE